MKLFYTRMRDYANSDCAYKPKYVEKKIYFLGICIYSIVVPNPKNKKPSFLERQHMELKHWLQTSSCKPERTYMNAESLSGFLTGINKTIVPLTGIHFKYDLIQIVTPKADFKIVLN